MSIARVTTVKSARKDEGTCGKCGTPLPKGSAYRWYTVGFRSHYKHRRCMAPTCTPLASELESSKVASIYAAQESAEDAINEATSGDDIQAAIDEVIEAIREVAEEYREAAVNPNTGEVFNLDSEERADTLEGSADELEGYDVELDEGCSECEGQGEIDCRECSGQGQVEPATNPSRTALSSSPPRPGQRARSTASRAAPTSATPLAPCAPSGPRPGRGAPSRFSSAARGCAAGGSQRTVRRASCRTFPWLHPIA